MITVKIRISVYQVTSVVSTQDTMKISDLVEYKSYHGFLPF